MPQIKIGASIFTVNPLLAEASFDLQPKLLPILPDIAKLYMLFVQEFAELVESGRKEIENTEAIAKGLELLDKAQPIIARLCSGLPPGELKYIRQTLLQGATCQGQPLYNSASPEGPHPINVLLQGRTLDLWRLLVFAVKESYPDFFGLLAAARARKAPAGEEDSAT